MRVTHAITKVVEAVREVADKVMGAAVNMGTACSPVGTIVAEVWWIDGPLPVVTQRGATPVFSSGRQKTLATASTSRVSLTKP